jgi:hypothetical protein
MKRLILTLDDHTAECLDAVAPARSPRRADFVRTAIQRALWDLSEKATEAAYARMPDAEPAYFDASVWSKGRRIRWIRSPA